MLNIFKRPAMIFWLLIAFTLVLMSSQPAAAQQLNQSWNFNTQNRASIAALMQQVENKDHSVIAASNAGYTNLVCGGGAGSSSADGNSVCIILNNSTGMLDTKQDSQGNQTANNEATTTTATNEETLSEALAVLNE